MDAISPQLFYEIIPSNPLAKNPEKLLRVRRLRLGAPSSSSSKKIALIKLLLRLRSHARIGVRAAGNKTNEQRRRGSAPEKTSTSINKAYDLTKHLHPRPPYLTSYIGVRC